MTLKIHFLAAYQYGEKVSFSPHIVRLWPRNDRFTTVRMFDFSTSTPSDIQYRSDLFDNVVASCFYPELLDTLEFRMVLEIGVEPRNPFHFLLDGEALVMPFSYPEQQAAILSPYLQVEPIPLPHPLRFTPPAPTIETLVAWNSWIHETVQYERREHGEPFPPTDTLERRRGSCRDMSVLFAAVLRQHGIAARLVSGYLWEPPEETERRAENALHAWVEAFLPGAGWVGFDPTNGVLCDHHRIATAVGITPKQIAPIVGSYFGDRIVPGRLHSELDISLT